MPPKKGKAAAAAEKTPITPSVEDSMINLFKAQFAANLDIEPILEMSSQYDEDSFSPRFLILQSMFVLNANVTLADEADLDIEDVKTAFSSITENLPDEIESDFKNLSSAALAIDIEECLDPLRQNLTAKAAVNNFNKKVGEKFSKDKVSHSDTSTKKAAEKMRKVANEQNKQLAEKMRKALLKDFPVSEVLKTCKDFCVEVTEKVEAWWSKQDKGAEPSGREPTGGWANIAAGAKRKAEESGPSPRRTRGGPGAGGSKKSKTASYDDDDDGGPPMAQPMTQEPGGGFDFGGTPPAPPPAGASGLKADKTASPKSKRPEKKTSRRKWEDAEENFLVSQLRNFTPGGGRIGWAEIQSAGTKAGIWNTTDDDVRTSVDIKDKTRNLVWKKRLPDDMQPVWSAAFPKKAEKAEKAAK